MYLNAGLVCEIQAPRFYLNTGLVWEIQAPLVCYFLNFRSWCLLIFVTEVIRAEWILMRTGWGMRGIGAMCFPLWEPLWYHRQRTCSICLPDLACYLACDCFGLFQDNIHIPLGAWIWKYLKHLVDKRKDSPEKTKKENLYIPDENIKCSISFNILASFCHGHSQKLPIQWSTNSHLSFLRYSQSEKHIFGPSC